MLPKADGGVVSPELIVYGTKVRFQIPCNFIRCVSSKQFRDSQNLRVIDARIMPLHIATHVRLLSHRASG